MEAITLVLSRAATVLVLVIESSLDDAPDNSVPLRYDTIDTAVSRLRGRSITSTVSLSTSKSWAEHKLG